MNGKVDLRVIKTHAKLRAALAEMMDTVSFDDITVFDLCEKAEVRRATFYKHFKDKYDFLKSVTTDIIDDIAKDVFTNDYNPESLVEYFTRFVKEIIVYFDNRPIILKNLLGSNTFPIIFDIITTCTQSAIFKDLLNAKRFGITFNTDIQLTAHFINGGISKILLEWFKNPAISSDLLLSKIEELLAKFFK